MFKRFTALVLALLLAVGTLPALPVYGAPAQGQAEARPPAEGQDAEGQGGSGEQAEKPLPVKVDAASAIVMEPDSGLMIYEKNIHEKHFPASTTKLMTLLLIVEAVERGEVSWEDMVTASANAAGYGGSQIYLAEGEVLSLKDLTLGIAVASGNDAAVCVGEYLAGSHEAFVERMNTRAQELGMKDTHFANANGLHDDNHYTTAWDLCQLAREAIRHPMLLEFTSTKQYRIRENTDKPFQYNNTNKLLWQFDGAKGLKTGWTLQAGYCLVGFAERDGLKMVSVVMGNPVAKGHINDTKALFTWAFNTYIRYRPAPQELPEVRLQVYKGKTAIVRGSLPEDWGIPARKGQEISIHYGWRGPVEIEAPVEEGQFLGYVTITDESQEIQLELPINASEAVEKAGFGFNWSRILSEVFS